MIKIKIKNNYYVDAYIDTISNHMSIKSCLESHLPNNINSYNVTTNLNYETKFYTTDVLSITFVKILIP